ncbi:MAG: hypothetical protein Fur005_07550 [Roseiflexaceae bacterium]
MSGTLKAGLLFGLLAIPLSVVSMLPTMLVPFAALCCGPLVALALGAGAGYMSIRWGNSEAGIGQGILASSLTGLGVLIGSTLFFVALIAIVSSMPEFEAGMREAMQQSLEAQGGDSGLTPETLEMVIGLSGLIAGACIGLFGLFFAIGGGALGAWLGVRNRPTPPPFATPPVAPPSEPTPGV